MTGRCFLIETYFSHTVASSPLLFHPTACRLRDNAPLEVECRERERRIWWLGTWKGLDMKCDVNAQQAHRVAAKTRVGDAGRGIVDQRKGIEENNKKCHDASGDDVTVTVVIDDIEGMCRT